MATNVAQVINDGVEKQPTVNKKEKYGQSARKVHKKKNDPRRIAAKQFLLGIASNVNSQTRPTSVVTEVIADSELVNDDLNSINNSTELAAKLGQQVSRTNSFGNDAVVPSTSERKIAPFRHPVVRSFSTIESPSLRRKVMVHAKWNTYPEGTNFDFPNTNSTSSKSRYTTQVFINIVCSKSYKQFCIHS